MGEFKEDSQILNTIHSQNMKEAEKIFEEIMAKSIPNLMENINLYILEATQVEKTQRKSLFYTL